jgi:hypothetical protein
VHRHNAFSLFFFPFGVVSYLTETKCSWGASCPPHSYVLDLLVAVVGKATAFAHEQYEKTKAQEPKPKLRTEDNQKLFTQQLISQKSIPFTCAGPSPFIGRRADFLHSENTLV